MSPLDFYRDTWAEVDLDAIYGNVSSMKSHLPKNVDVMAVVKGNAYGHGVIPVAKTALEAGATKLAVALLDEALRLRHEGIRAPILVLGLIRPEDIQLAIKHQISVTAFQLEWFKKALEFCEADDVINIHVKVDTGMGRLGLRNEDELKGILDICEKNPCFHFEGIFTHFATADEEDTMYFNKQYSKFIEMVEYLKKENIHPDVIHCANSATGLRFPDKVFNAVRFGISMYGLSPSIQLKNQLPFELQEAFSLHSRISHVKKIKPGDKISYGIEYEAKEEEWIGTLPIGYADGWIRKLRTADVLIHGIRCPIVGRICMDQLMIRLPYQVELGEHATLIGRQNNAFISIDEIAMKLETINYEIPCTITSRVPRIFLRKKRILEVENIFLQQSQ